MFALLVCLFFAASQSKYSQAYAQSKFSILPVQTVDKDRDLATTIKRLANRSSVGLVVKKVPKGGSMIDLQDRFQNVMLSKIDTDGEPVAACVTSLDEANSFFGRDLETGQSLPSYQYDRDITATLAARHGMSVGEFEFYKNLIEEAKQRLTDNPSSATLAIINGDGAGEGFNDPTPKTPEGGNSGTTLGQQRLNLFNFAASIWGAYLDSSVTTNINSKFDPLSPCSASGGVLGSAGPNSAYINFTNALFPNTIYHAALANKLSGTDLNGGSPEINATFNSNVDTGCLGSGTRYYYGLDNSTPSRTVNLLVVLLHEMGHGLGFSSFVNGSTGALNGGYTDVYTHFMYDRSTNKYWDQMTNIERQISATNTGNVLWDGANVKIASGYLTGGRDTSGRVQLFMPNPLQGGSSISHFDTAASPNLLMEPSINFGLPSDLDLTRQQMRDIGWYRDTNADLIPDTITNVTPNGSTVKIGNTVNITWTNTGGFNRSVTIELSTDGGATYPTTVASNVANTGSYSWTVPNNPTSQARIRVREYDFVAPSGVSTSNFAISSAGGTGAQGIEGDVTPHPDGDGSISISDVQQLLRFQTNADSNYQSNEFQRADCAPRNPAGNSGDGAVTISDVQQALRYQSGADPQQAAGGPTAPTGGTPVPSPLAATMLGIGSKVKAKNAPAGAARTLRVVGGSGSAGQTVTVQIVVDNASGTERGFGFSLNYDNRVLTYNSATLGADAPAANSFLQVNPRTDPNDANNGQLGVGILFSSDFPAGSGKQLLVLQFTIANGATAAQTTPITFGDAPAKREVTDVNAMPLVPTFYQDGSVTILGTTAAGVEVGGRVENGRGRGVAKAQVVMTNSQGETRTARSNAFGYFKITDVPSGETYIITVKSKQYRFSAQVVNVTQDLTDLIITAQPR